MKNQQDLDTFRPKLGIICYKENHLNIYHCYFLLKNNDMIEQTIKQILSGRLTAAPGCNTYLTLACYSSEGFYLLTFCAKM